MKVVKQITVDQAAELVKDGDTIFGGGFGMTGNPVHLLNALAKTSVKNLTYIGNNVGEPNLECTEVAQQVLGRPCPEGGARPVVGPVALHRGHHHSLSIGQDIECVHTLVFIGR